MPKPPVRNNRRGGKPSSVKDLLSKAGLGPGEIITQIGRDKISSIADFRRVADKIGKGQVVRLAVTFYSLPSQRGEEPRQESRFIFFQAD